MALSRALPDDTSFRQVVIDEIDRYHSQGAKVLFYELLYERVIDANTFQPYFGFRIRYGIPTTLAFPNPVD